MTDVNEANLQIRLRMSIEGDRVYVRSTDFVKGARPIRLIGGMPTSLSNLDLRPYFDLRNLQGITPRQYNTPLPDGLYRFCFEVFDFVTGRQLSQKRCIPVYLVLNDPPFLNLPQRGEQIGASNPQNLIFQWTPRHLNATGVQYEFQLRELWDGGIDPQAAFLASPDLYRTTTFATTLHYGPGETTLLEGKTYGWRVRAIVGDGISETSVFRNNGFSEIFNFTYTGKCDVPKFILAKSEGTSSETISWQTDPNHIGYQVQYRKPGKSGAVWFEAETTGTTKTLIFLEPATTYEFRVGGQCLPDGGYSFSPVNTFTTPSREEAAQYNCGIPPEILITNKKPLEALGPGDKFTAGDFPVKVVEASGGNGTFSGRGVIEVPYLALIKIAVVFNNINTDGQMTGGTVETDYDADFATGTNAGSLALGKPKTKRNNEPEPTETEPTDESVGAEDTTAETKVDEPSADETDLAKGSEGSTDTENNDASANDTSMADAGGPNPGDGNAPATDAPAVAGNTGNEPDVGTDRESDGEAGEAVIEHNGLQYANGDVIELAYDRNMESQTFKLLNVPEVVNISWSTFANMASSEETHSNTTGKTAIFDIKEYGSRALKAEWKSEDIPGGDPKQIKVDIRLVKKKFELKELYASHKKKRVAKSGETLYLLDDTGLTESSKYKSIAYSAALDSKIKEKEISASDLKWYFGEDATVPEDISKINISRNLRQREGFYRTTLTAGYPNATDKSIDVKWVDQYDESTDFISRFSPVLTFLEQFNRISSKFNAVLPCEVSILRNFDALRGAKQIDFKYRRYNEEDLNGREIYDIDQLNIKLKIADLVSLSCGKSVGFMSLSLGDIYGGMKLGSTMDFKYSYKVKNESGETKHVPTVSGGLVLTTDIGFKSNKAMDDYLLVKAAIEIKAGTKTVYPYKGNKSLIGNYFYLGKTNFVFEGNVDTWLTGKQEINFKYLIYDSSWRSKNKLIIDFDKKDIYLIKDD